MEPILLIVSTWWWVAPAAAGAGAMTYAGLTTRGRRARRLELDAARLEETQAYRALVAAKAQVRTAQADMLAAKARGAGAQTAETRRELQAAKQSEKAASLALRASRARVKAGHTQYTGASANDPLPIDRLYAAHDAANARWLVYETDVDKALAHPQMTDTRHPATVVFLRAQREALAKRPMLRDRVSPAQYLEYRGAVRALETALTEAERQAGVPGAHRSTTPPGAGAASAAASAAASVSAAAAGVSAAAIAIADLAGRFPSLISRLPTTRETPPPPDRAP